jgi:hypothetical protein
MIGQVRAGRVLGVATPQLGWTKADDAATLAPKDPQIFAANGLRRR